MAPFLASRFEVTAAADTLATLVDGNHTALLRAIPGSEEALGNALGPLLTGPQPHFVGAARLEGLETAELLVRLQELILDALASPTVLELIAPMTATGPASPARSVSNGDGPLGSAGGSG